MFKRTKRFFKLVSAVVIAAKREEAVLFISDVDIDSVKFSGIQMKIRGKYTKLERVQQNMKPYTSYQTIITFKPKK